ncbi:flippase-like domain-containing protein [Litoribacter alkaliphilus]|uniref:Flippase-like domain-containing protein n=1 Tax=Litoribacter ruber TaxID=702568 RepID=A0AAP2CIZ9_9BACT|nr:lysylphosphatidylglycerol synthase transmembrane domain-containing protein [Litoribacter alkaliphilus]MBS9525616.1 flippase-like domain-containing protein [Litoribacter alkaliphilus]
MPTTKIEKKKQIKVSEQVKNKLKLIVKLAVTGLAMWLVSTKVDLGEVAVAITKAHPGYLLLALLFFVLSKVVSAVRLKYFFREIDVHLSHIYNFRLYLIGMFHNLYLPGGVGGDGYKVYLLNKESQKPVKKLVSSVLFDRISGLVALIFLALVLSYISSIRMIFNEFEVYGLILLILAYPGYIIITKKLFPGYHKNLYKTSALSLLTQNMQLVCTYFLLRSLGVENQILEYQALFMLASIATIVPITFGGIGVREMVFIASYQVLALDKGIGVSFSLLFFAITALVSFSGAFLKATPKKETDVETAQSIHT